MLPATLLLRCSHGEASISPKVPCDLVKQGVASCSPPIGKPRPHRAIRLSNWDFLRSLCMLAVVVVHSGSYLGTLAGINAGSIASTAAILCDPIFFALSGYFAIRPLKRSLFSYYSRKVSTIILPLFVYSFLLYLYSAGFTGLSIHGYIAYFSQVLTPLVVHPSACPLFSCRALLELAI